MFTREKWTVNKKKSISWDSQKHCRVQTENAIAKDLKNVSTNDKIVITAMLSFLGFFLEGGGDIFSSTLK